MVNEVQIMSYPSAYLKVTLLPPKVQCAFVLAAREELQIESKATGDNLTDCTN